MWRAPKWYSSAKKEEKKHFISVSVPQNPQVFILDGRSFRRSSTKMTYEWIIFMIDVDLNNARVVYNSSLLYVMFFFYFYACAAAADTDQCMYLWTWLWVVTMCSCAIGNCGRWSHSMWHHECTGNCDMCNTKQYLHLIHSSWMPLEHLVLSLCPHTRNLSADDDAGIQATFKCIRLVTVHTELIYIYIYIWRRVSSIFVFLILLFFCCCFFGKEFFHLFRQFWMLENGYASFMALFIPNAFGRFLK